MPDTGASSNGRFTDFRPLSAPPSGSLTDQAAPKKKAAKKPAAKKAAPKKKATKKKTTKKKSAPKKK